MKKLLLLTSIPVSMLALSFLISAARGYDEVEVLHPGMTYKVSKLGPDKVVCVSDRYSIFPMGAHYQIARIDTEKFSFLKAGERFQVTGSGPITAFTRNPEFNIDQLPN